MGPSGSLISQRLILDLSQLKKETWLCEILIALLPSEGGFYFHRYISESSSLFKTQKATLNLNKTEIRYKLSKV